MWQDATHTVSRHHFVILNPSSRSLGPFTPDSFKILLTGLSEGIMKRLAARIFLDQVSVLYVPHLHILSLCCLLLLFAFFGSKDFLKKAHFWSWCISDFCGCFFFFFLPLLYIYIYIYIIIIIFYIGWVEAVFFSSLSSSVCKETLKKTVAANKHYHARLNSVHTLIYRLLFFFFFFSKHAVDAEVFAADKGNQSRWESWGIFREMKGIQ